MKGRLKGYATTTLLAVMVIFSGYMSGDHYGRTFFP